MPNTTVSTLVAKLRDPLSLAIRRQVERVARLTTPVLLFGETGVGKDMFAEYLHARSAGGPLLNLHCGDVPEPLLESEWFGCKKGAFSGADSDRDGKWKLAAGGTLFLNRIDLLPLHLQAKLLRIVERRRYYPLGANREEEVRARFVFSADADIEEKVRRHEFRADLFFRISAYKIFLPPLRERKLDIPVWLAHFAAAERIELRLPPRARRLLADYPWPGNIRELENFVRGAAIGKTAVDEDDVRRLLAGAAQILDLAKTREWSLERLEAEYLEFLLRKYGNKSRVAEILKISRKSLYDRLKRNETR